MKIVPFLRALALFSFFSTWQTGCHSMQKLADIPLGYYLFMGAHVGIGQERSLVMAYGQMPWEKHSWRNRQEATKIVQDYVYAQLDARKDKELIAKLRIKKFARPQSASSMYANTNRLMINEEDHDNLAALLVLKKRGETLTQEQQDLLAFYTMVIHHEISHIKNNDSRKARIFYPATGLLLQGLTWGLAKLCSISHYYSPSHFHDNQDPKEIFKGACFLVLSGIAQTVIHRKLINYYERKQELQADADARNAAKNAETLHRYARYLAAVRQVKEAEELIDQVITALQDPFSLNIRFKWYGYLLKRQFIKQHPQYTKTFNDKNGLAAFRSWLKKQPNVLDALERMNDPIHDTDTGRIAKAKKAAALLVQKSAAP